jgi:probable phosphoglycerate mutase
MEQKWPSHLLILRHGESERNVAKDQARSKGAHSYGSGLRDLDTPLTDRGHRQARTTGEHLAKDYTLDAVFCSRYLRTRQTAEEILEQLGRKPALFREERIREMEFGILDGLTTKGLQTLYPEEFARREREGKYWFRPPGGESRPDVALRVHSFLGTLTRDYLERSLLIVCHSVVVLVFRRLLERWGEEEYFKVDAEDDVLNCSVTAYRFDRDRNKLVLDFYNKTYYQKLD